ncbi:hypothetical protein [Azospirillum thiophilum]|uniref:hypothetical protein n=1 Tax=Azospirillum thiophilum TaxID=528244 RepID=UPI001314D7E3|nr:hypothetical protein [Azospirillum thiophilum]
MSLNIMPLKHNAPVRPAQRRAALPGLECLDRLEVITHQVCQLVVIDAAFDQD